jgi:hypothetical protein
MHYLVQRGRGGCVQRGAQYRRRGKGGERDGAMAIPKALRKGSNGPARDCRPCLGEHKVSFG